MTELVEEHHNHLVIQHRRPGLGAGIREIAHQNHVRHLPTADAAPPMETRGMLVLAGPRMHVERDLADRCAIHRNLECLDGWMPGLRVGNRCELQSEELAVEVQDGLLDRRVLEVRTGGTRVKCELL